MRPAANPEHVRPERYPRPISTEYRTDDHGAAVSVLTFSTTTERDDYLDRWHADRAGQEEPGTYRISGGRELFVFCHEVRIYG